MTKLLVTRMTAFFLVLSCSSAFARTGAYDLRMELAIDGRHISSPRIVAKADETASITQESGSQKIFLDVKASEQAMSGKPGIHLKFLIGTISSTGQRKVLSSAEIIALEGKEAQITIGHQPGQEDISLAVVATRKAL